MAPSVSNINIVLRATGQFPSELLHPSKEYLTTTITSLTACITLMIALSYLVGLSWVLKFAQAHPKPLNKGSGVHLQKYAPRTSAVFSFRLSKLGSLTENGF